MIHGIIQILLIFFIFIFYIEIKKWLTNRKLIGFEASPHQIPIIGGAARFFGKRNDELIEAVLNLFNEVKTTPFYLWLGPILAVGVSEPQDLQIVMTHENSLNKPFFYDYCHCKTSIIATPKETWKRDRRALNTSFNNKVLQNYIKPLNEKSHILIEKMESHLNEPDNIYRTIFICMMDMIVRTTMGSEINLQSEESPGAFLYTVAKKIMNNLQYRVARIWLRWDFVYSHLSKVGRDEQQPLKHGNKIFYEIYGKKMSEIALLKSRGIDYLEDIKELRTMNVLEKCLQLEQEGTFSNENVLDQMRVVILAGIDTSSITVFGTLLMLAINQKHQDLVVDELRSIFETADCDVIQEHLSEMKYTERVIKEAMRLIPPVPFIARKATADIGLPRGTVPNGAMILINIMLLHRNPKIWGDNALEFNPDRFLPENVAKRPPYSYIPFSGGPRNCIGMRYAMISAKITLAHLLRRYKFTSDLRFQDIRLNTHLVTEVINEKPLRIEQRKF